MSNYPVATVATPSSNGNYSNPSSSPFSSSPDNNNNNNPGGTNNPNNNTILWGIPVDEHTVDSSFVSTTRNVLRVSILSGFFAILSAIVMFALHNNFQGSIATALLIPLCGYLGVKNKNKTLIKLFCCCNCFCVILFVISTITIVEVTLPIINCVCAQNCDETILDAANRPGPGRNNGLPLIGDNSTLTPQWEDICSQESQIEQGYTAAIVLGAIMAILQCYGCIYSNKLLDSSYFAVHSAVAQFAVVGSPVMAYPQGMNSPPIMYGYPGYPPGMVPPNGVTPVMVPYPMPYPNGGGGGSIMNNNNGGIPVGYPPMVGGYNHPPPGVAYPPGLQMRSLYPSPPTTTNNNNYPPSASTTMNNHHNNDIPSKIPPSYTVVQGFPPVSTSTTTTTTNTASYNDDNPRN